MSGRLATANKEAAWRTFREQRVKETRKERTGRAALRGRPARSEGVFCAQALRQRVPGAFRVTARRARGREHGGQGRDESKEEGGVGPACRPRGPLSSPGLWL